MDETTATGIDTNHAAAIIAVAALAFLVLVRRGFRGVLVTIPT
jgi:hypothetical protein